jgi:hypothetical protein
MMEVRCSDDYYYSTAVENESTEVVVVVVVVAVGHIEPVDSFHRTCCYNQNCLEEDLSLR